MNTVGIENKKQPIQKQELKSAKESNTNLNTKIRFWERERERERERHVSEIYVK